MSKEAFYVYDLGNKSYVCGEVILDRSDIGYKFGCIGSPLLAKRFYGTDDGKPKENNFTQAMKKVFPKSKFVKVTVSFKVEDMK